MPHKRVQRGRNAVKKSNLDWPAILFIALYHLLLLILLPWYLVVHGSPSIGLVLTTVILISLTGTSISAGYHRFYAHRAYSLNKGVEAILLFFGTIALQQSVLQWSYGHRMHHRFVDTEKDPYSIRKGFWYAHLLWIFERGKPIEYHDVRDLTKSRLVMWQDKYYLPLTILLSAVVTGAAGILFQDMFGAFVFTFLVRVFSLHHLTWFINSLAHTWGARSYAREQSAADNYFISLLTFGEGYHNYHHAFASDYRNGIRWYHVDPTKWLVWFLSKIGLAHSLIRMNTFIITHRLIDEDKKLMLQKIKRAIAAKRYELGVRIEELSQRLRARLTTLRQMKEAYAQAKEAKKTEKEREQLKVELKIQKKEVKRDWRAWCALTKKVVRQKFPLSS